jgi:predicted transcriptional regulator
MIFIIIAAILTVLSLSYYISGKNNYSSSEDKIVKLEQELRTSLSKMRLKKVSNPQQVKDSVEKTFKARPSAILHSAAEVASLFGVLETITLTKNYQDRFTRAIENKPQDDVIYVQANVRANENSLLIDQERLAKSVYETRKWIRSIERSNRSGDGSLTLKIGVYVGDYGD